MPEGVEPVIGHERQQVIELQHRDTPWPEDEPRGPPQSRPGRLRGREGSCRSGGLPDRRSRRAAGAVASPNGRPRTWYPSRWAASARGGDPSTMRLRTPRSARNGCKYATVAGQLHDAMVVRAQRMAREHVVDEPLRVRAHRLGELVRWRTGQGTLPLAQNRRAGRASRWSQMKTCNGQRGWRLGHSRRNRESVVGLRMRPEVQDLSQRLMSARAAGGRNRE